jgi:hypothetical protein
MSSVKSHHAVESRRPPGRTSWPAAHSALGWAACVRRDAGKSIHPFLRATSREPCCGDRRSRSPGPVMPCSRASNSRKPDLVVSLEYPMTSLCWLTQLVPRPEAPATGSIHAVTKETPDRPLSEASGEQDFGRVIRVIPRDRAARPSGGRRVRPVAAPCRARCRRRPI